ncbi:MAG: AsmA-like C-terminal region-containing protein [Nitrospirales bacterium]
MIDKIFVDGVDLLLEEGPHETNNWTFGTSSEPSTSSNTEPPISATITEEGFVGIQRVMIAYQPHVAAGPESQVTIIEGTVFPGEDRTRKISLRGTFQETPFTIDLIGGGIIDLLDLRQSWPFDGVLIAADTTLKAKGQLNEFHNDPYLEITASLSGADLSSLNPLFQTDLPPYGPYELITSVSLSTHTLSLENSHLKVGQTDLSGLFIMDFKEERTRFHSRLMGETLQIKDFQFSEPENNPAHTSPPSPDSFAKQIGMADIDIDLELAVNTFLVDTHNFGKIGLSANLEKGLLRVTPFRAETFGGVIAGSLELDGNYPAPRVTLGVTAQNWDYGQALQAFDVTNDIAGSTNLAIALRGQGATLQEFLDQATLSINAGPSSLVFVNEENTDNMAVGIRQATVKVAPGKNMKARVKGNFKEKAIDVWLVTGPLAQLTTPDKPWPIALLARSDDAALTIKGGMRSEREGMRVTLAASLKGQRLNRLDPALPPSGPYVFTTQLIKSGSQYFFKDLKGRVGQSDLSGFASLNMEKDIPFLVVAFSSAYLDMTDLTNPGDATPDDILIPIEPLQDLGADFTWKIKRMRAETIQLRDLTVDGNLKNGRLAFTTLKGNFFDHSKSGLWSLTTRVSEQQAAGWCGKSGRVFLH